MARNTFARYGIGLLAVLCLLTATKALAVDLYWDPADTNVVIDWDTVNQVWGTVYPAAPDTTWAARQHRQRHFRRLGR